MTREIAGWTRLDLHLHSTRSDGRFAPEEVLARCARGGLDVIALTDHDLAPSLPVGEHRVDDRTVRLLGGAEVTGTHDGRELHLLVYFPDEVPEGFRAFCRGQALERVRRYEKAVEKIALPGLPAPDSEALRGERALTRHHLARALVDLGHASNLHEAFAKHARSGIVPHIELTFVDAIRIAKSHGGVTSWAHPAPDHVARYLPTFVAAGLQGLEATRPSTSSRDVRLLRRAAKRFGLFCTGGSDWHGWEGVDLGLFALRAEDLRGFLDALAA